MIIRRAVWTVAFLIGLVLAPGCKNPLAPTIHSVFPVGRLIAGETCKLKLICNVEATNQSVLSVIVDLSMLGSDTVQELTQQPDGTWRWEGEVNPDAQGAKQIFITATDNASRESKKEIEVQVHAPGKAIAISGGFQHSIALKDDGTIACWGGEEIYEECGDMPADLKDVVAIEAGDLLSLAVKYDGTIACWDGTWDGHTPCNTILSAGMSDIVAVSGALFLKADGTVIYPFCAANALCDTIQSLKNVVAIANGYHVVMVLKSDGTITAWCDGPDEGQCDVPVGLDNVVAIVGSYFRGLALRSDGSVVAWGGQKGQPVSNRMVPLGLGRLKAVSSKGSEMRDLNVGLRQDGTMVVWHRGRGGLLYKVETGPANIIAVAAGWYHFMALSEDGSIQAWGDNAYGQCNVPAELQ